MMSQKEIVAAYMEQARAQMMENEVQEGEFTVRMFMEELGIPTTYNKSARWLDGEVAKGKLSVRKASIDGKEMNVYKPV